MIEVYSQISGTVSLLQSFHDDFVHPNGTKRWIQKDNPDWSILNAEGLYEVQRASKTTYQKYSSPQIVNNIAVIGVEDVSLEEAKTIKTAEIKQAFCDEMCEGRMATGLGWDVDARSSGINDDLRNVTNLIKDMQAKAETQTYFKDADNQDRIVTLEELITIEGKLIEEGRARYGKKHSLESQVTNANDIATIEGISW